MGFFSDFRKARATLTARESTETLDHMTVFFGDGANWTQGTYHRTNGTKCLVGAADYVRVSAIDDAKYWLKQAIAEREPGMRSIEHFNDTRTSYHEVAAVLTRARQLATAAQLPSTQRQLSPPAAELLPPRRRQPVTIDVTPLEVLRQPQRARARRPNLGSVMAQFLAD